MGFAATFVSMAIGGAIGVVSGYFGGWVDTVLMRITDYFLVIPDVPLMIVVAAIWGPSLFHIIIVIGILLWTSTARVIRAQVKSVRERVYVKRARALGAGHSESCSGTWCRRSRRFWSRTPFSRSRLRSSTRRRSSFLGLGDPEHISLGQVIENAFQRAAISSGAWWAIVPPGVLVALIILGCSLVGGALEDALNPRLRVAHLGARTFRLRPLVGRGRTRYERAAAGDRGPPRLVRPRGRRRAARCAGSELRARAGRADGARRRVGLREDDDGARDPGAPAAERKRRRAVS